jgi:hypothetical protein
VPRSSDHVSLAVSIMPGPASAHPAPALVVDVQAGITLGSDGGEPRTDFCHQADHGSSDSALAMSIPLPP